MRSPLLVASLSLVPALALAQPAPAPVPPPVPPPIADPAAPPPPPAPAMVPPTATAPAPMPAPMVEAPPAPVAPQRSFSITASPIHLALPMVELAIEAMPTPNLGVQIIGGLGRVSDEADTITGTATEIGGQLNYYFTRPFSGLHAGAEVLYLHLGDIDVDVAASGAGLAAGPYVGYKVLTRAGFTFVAQLGAEFLVVKAKAGMSTSEDKKVFPLLNLNLGWSL